MMSKRHHLSEPEEDECPNEKRSRASDIDEIVPCFRNESSKSYFVLWVKGTLKIITITEKLEKGKNDYTKLQELLRHCMTKAEEEQAREKIRADEATNNKSIEMEFQLSEALLLVKEKEEENQTLIYSVKQKDCQIHDLQNRYEEKERMLKLSENELAQTNSKNKSLERFLNEQETKNQQEKEMANLQHNNKITRMNQEKAALAEKYDSEKTENAKLKMQLQTAEKNRAQIEKLITEETEKMFHKWKKDHERKAEKENDEKDRRIQELEKQLCNGPKWLVEKKLCKEMFKNQKSTSFLNQFTEELFTSVEILQPLKQLPKKEEEISKIIDYFYKNEKPEVKRMYLKELNTTLNARRRNVRNSQFKKCNKYRSIGITSDGKKFYYSLKPASNQKWLPFSDRNCREPLDFKMPKLSSFGIPLKYALCEYILIISSNSDNGDGGEIHKMYPKRGFIERISKRQKTSKAV